MKKALILLTLILLLLTTCFVSLAEKPDQQSLPYTNYSNKDTYENGLSNYSISFNYVKSKGYNASAVFEAPFGMTTEEIENIYVNPMYRDATLWLWDFTKALWIPIPLELKIQLDENELPSTIEFAANWQDNSHIDRVTLLDINTAIADALISNKVENGNDSSACWLELAVGNWVEFNSLSPSGSNRIQGELPSPPFVEPTFDSFSNYSNIAAYADGLCHYSIAFNYIKDKGYSASASFEAPESVSAEELKSIFVNELYPDATLWLWDFEKGLWIPIPLELNILFDESDQPAVVEFTANWKVNQQDDRVTLVELNKAIENALQSNWKINGHDWSNCWLELAVGNWVEFNVLYPE